MKTIGFLSCIFFLFQTLTARAQQDPASYLSALVTELQKQWPHNRAINLVFHGHSVPAGYFKTPDVQTLNAYPHQVLQLLKQQYPYAVVNSIVTAIGGENAESGAKRFEKDVLTHQPDIILIDYALNDRRLGLEKAKAAWISMIEAALAKQIRVILLTPSPDTTVNILQDDNILEQHSKQIRQLAAQYQVGLADSYATFRLVAAQKQKIEDYMSQVNHPNRKGHTLIAREIMKYFISNRKN